MQTLGNQALDSEDLPTTAVPGHVTAMATTEFVLLSGKSAEARLD